MINVGVLLANNTYLKIYFRIVIGRFFSAAQSSNHCLCHLSPAKLNRSNKMSLRPRGHNFCLPLLKYGLLKILLLTDHYFCMSNTTNATVVS